MLEHGRWGKITEIPQQGPTKGDYVCVSVYPVSDSEGMQKMCVDDHLRHVESSGTTGRNELICLQTLGQ